MATILFYTNTSWSKHKSLNLLYLYLRAESGRRTCRQRNRDSISGCYENLEILARARSRKNSGRLARQKSSLARKARSPEKLARVSLLTFWEKWPSMLDFFSNVPQMLH